MLSPDHGPLRDRSALLVLAVPLLAFVALLFEALGSLVQVTAGLLHELVGELLVPSHALTEPVVDGAVLRFTDGFSLGHASPCTHGTGVAIRPVGRLWSVAAIGHVLCRPGHLVLPQPWVTSPTRTDARGEAGRLRTTTFHVVARPRREPDDAGMTAITIPPSRLHDPAPPERRLRGVLALNAATSLAVGVAGLIAADWWSERLGLDSPGWTRIVSVALIAFALDVALAARSRPARLRAGAALVSAADVAWVAATIVVLATGRLSGAGVVVAVVLGVGVADFAALQLWFRHRMGGD